MNGLKVLGWGAIIFGILILIFPDIVNYLIAIFFILVGVNILAFGRQFRP